MPEVASDDKAAEINRTHTRKLSDERMGVGGVRGVWDGL